ncbi:MAG: penicillin-binding protein activator [bacterium]
MIDILKFKAVLVSVIIFLALLSPSVGWTWDLVMQDKWGDQWEFNKIKEDNYAVYYDGQWRWEARRNEWKTGKAAAAYIKEGTAMTLAGFYEDGDTAYNVIYPYYAWYNNKNVYRWYGVKHWVRDTQYMENIYFDVKQGQVYWFRQYGLDWAAKPWKKIYQSLIPSPMGFLEDTEPGYFKKGAKLSAIPSQSEDTTIRIGALFPLSGDSASLGESDQAALNLAIEHINEIFAQEGLSERVEVVIRDTETNPLVAGQRMFELKQAGIDVVLGPATSEIAYMLLGHANTNGMLLLSSSSTAVPLSIAGDNLMRLMPDDSHQARALADQLELDGITDLVILTRTDIYGNDLSNKLADSFRAGGGRVPGFFTYPRSGSQIEEVVQSMDETVAERIAEIGAERVAVVIILLDEGIDILSRATKYQSLEQVKWYGTDSMAQNPDLFLNTDAASFAVKTQFTCSTSAISGNEKAAAIETELTERLGYPPESVSLNTYDAAFLVARALLRTDTQDISAVQEAIRLEAQTYSGATSPILFNEAGDRAQGNYDFWRVDQSDGRFQWTYASTWEWTVPVGIVDWRIR